MAEGLPTTPPCAAAGSALVTGAAYGIGRAAAPAAGVMAAHAPERRPGAPVHEHGLSPEETRRAIALRRTPSGRRRGGGDLRGAVPFFAPPASAMISGASPPTGGGFCSV